MVDVVRRRYVYRGAKDGHLAAGCRRVLLCRMSSRSLGFVAACTETSWYQVSTYVPR